MEQSSFSAELQTLIERVAAHPRGLGLLRQTELECAAITFGVHPRVILAARNLLEVPRQRARMIEEVRAARRRQQADAAQLCAGDLSPLGAELPKDTRDLIHSAHDHPHGLPFLLYADPEVVAVTFHVHPHVVFEAREALRHGRVPGRSRSEGWRHHRPRPTH